MSSKRKIVIHFERKKFGTQQLAFNKMVKKILNAF